MVYWRQREISRTGYIAEALQDSIKQRIYSQSEPQERKEMLTKPYSNILKRNSHAVSGGQVDAQVQDMNEVMVYQKKTRCSSSKGKGSLKKRGRTSKMFSFRVALLSLLLPSGATLCHRYSIVKSRTLTQTTRSSAKAPLLFHRFATKVHNKWKHLIRSMSSVL